MKARQGPYEPEPRQRPDIDEVAEIATVFAPTAMARKNGRHGQRT
jgi:hypothetical protein